MSGDHGRMVLCEDGREPLTRRAHTRDKTMYSRVAGDFVICHTFLAYQREEDPIDRAALLKGNNIEDQDRNFRIHAEVSDRL